MLVEIRCMKMRKVLLILLTLFIVLITSCFDDDNDSSSTVVDDESAEGIYSFLNSVFLSFKDSSNSPRQLPVDVVIANTGEARFLFIQQNIQFVGNVNVKGGKLTASLKPFSGGDALDSIVELNGVVVTKDNIQGDYTWGEDFGRFVLNYSPLYEQSSSLSKLEGMWTFNEASSGGTIFTITITVDPDGTLFGSNTEGCIYNGKFGIIDSRYNVYSMSIELSLCGDLNGEYEGLAFLSGDLLAYNVSNDNKSIRGGVQALQQ